MSKGIKALIYLTILAVIGVAVFAGIILYNTSATEQRIFKGIYINDINVGGMTKEEAAELLENKVNIPIADRKMNLNYGDYNYEINYKALNAHYDVNSAILKGFEYGKDGNVIKKLEQDFTQKERYSISIEFVYDKNAIDKIVSDIGKKLNQDPKDASITFDGKNFSVIDDVPGLSVNQDRLKQLIEEAVKVNSKIDNIDIPIENTEAKISSELLSKINTKISSFTTTFKPSDVNRTENLKIAVKQTNGIMIMPGEIFSMNKALGPREASKGYKEAPVIINGTIAPALAGGICQVTSTLYNTVLLCNLEVVERSQHGIAVSYVGVGRDATISGNVLDFKFRNSHQYPIYIYASMGKSSLSISLYGANEHPGQYVEIKTEVLERIKPNIEYINDSTLDVGVNITEVKPITGIKSKTYKKVYQDGKFISEKMISSDFYKPVKGKIRIGTRPLTTTAPEINSTEPVYVGN